MRWIRTRISQFTGPDTRERRVAHDGERPRDNTWRVDRAWGAADNAAE
jgi:hypothetical protein